MNAKTMNKLLKITLVGLFVVVLLGLFFADKKLTDAANSTTQLKAQAEIDSKRLENYELTKIKIEELGYVKDIAKQILPDSENQSVIVAELAEFGRRSNLQTGSITFAEAAKTTSKDPKDKAANKVPEGVAVVPVVFTVSETAQYQDLLNFLKYIEQNRRKMQITQISLTPNLDNGEELQDISVSLNLFVKKAPEEKKEE